MRIGIFGTGYVGLVTAVCFAKLGHSVVAMDKDPGVIARLAAGLPTLYEPGLRELLEANLGNGRLTFTTSPEVALRTVDLVFLCVGTPLQADGSADLSQLDEVIGALAPRLDGYKLIVEKSTVPVNTAVRMERVLRQLTAPGVEFDVASNPEFLREGSAIDDFLHPDRIVIGADSARARAMLLDLYQHDFDCPILVTDVGTAELIKHAANSFLATKISFINMVADLCDQVGADVSLVARGIGLDRRIGPDFLQAGLGFGGSCLGKDLKAFVRIAEDLGVDFGLLREVDRVNSLRADRLFKKLTRALWVIRNKTVAVFGVAFKPNTDDIREAVSLCVVPRLREYGAHVRIYDPKAAAKFAERYPAGDRLSYAQSAYEAVEGAHAVVLLTEWNEFRSLDWERVRAIMAAPVVVDGRNVLDPPQMHSRGFEYYSLGRGDVTAAGPRSLLTIGDTSLHIGPPVGENGDGLWRGHIRSGESSVNALED
jgi:UDPglucose 6-dehydrogenase